MFICICWFYYHIEKPQRVVTDYFKYRVFFPSKVNKL
jgi:hypothetical protein